MNRIGGLLEGLKAVDKVWAIEPITDKVLRGTVTSISEYRKDTDRYVSFQTKKGKNYRFLASLIFTKKPVKVTVEDCMGSYTKWIEGGKNNVRFK